MDMRESVEAINYWAVLAAALSSFLVGGIWYSVLFAKLWMKVNGFTEEELKRSNQAAIFGGSFMLAAVIAFFLALFLGPNRDAGMGALAGLMAGLFWVAASFGITYLFERKPMSLFFVNAGYHVVTYTLMGIILGAWK